jgi:hypothetical protein
MLCKQVAWAVWSTVGTGSFALLSRAALSIPAYNWRLFSLIALVSLPP